MSTYQSSSSSSILQLLFNLQRDLFMCRRSRNKHLPRLKQTPFRSHVGTNLLNCAESRGPVRSSFNQIIVVSISASLLLRTVSKLLALTTLLWTAVLAGRGFTRTAAMSWRQEKSVNDAMDEVGSHIEDTEILSAIAQPIRRAALTETLRSSQL